ncbi:MAG TPA: alpha/beta family hydrolase [Candidatus Binataceae bacterium]|nr:alpha/beta family hydrolase [Candidatus Binataceae bacterium]
MKEQPITFPSGELTLEGLIAKPESLKEARGAVVCHPHPLYGGSMYNNVVDAALEAMWRLGWATLRFNFRGVGGSEGEHGGGAGEADDAAAAVGYLAEQSGVKAEGIVLAGYSFGAMAATNAAPGLKNLGALTLIALPIRMANTDALRRFSGPLILAAGDHDDYCPASQLQAIHEDLAGRAQLKIIQGADHFFGGYEEELADALESMLRRI